MSAGAYQMDLLLTQIRDGNIQQGQIWEWVNKCLTAFKQEAYPHLDTIQNLISRYKFDIGEIHKDCDDIEQAGDIDYLRFLVIHITNMFVFLFRIGPFESTDWDEEIFINSLVGHMQFQVQKDQWDKVATSTRLALHFCDTFVKQMQLLCAIQTKEIEPSTEPRILPSEEKKNSFKDAYAELSSLLGIEHITEILNMTDAEIIDKCNNLEVAYELIAIRDATLRHIADNSSRSRSDLMFRLYDLCNG